MTNWGRYHGLTNRAITPELCFAEYATVPAQIREREKGLPKGGGNDLPIGDLYVCLPSVILKTYRCKESAHRTYRCKKSAHRRTKKLLIKSVIHLFFMYFELDFFSKGQESPASTKIKMI